MACLRELVPRSVLTQPSLDTPPTSMRYLIFKAQKKKKGEHKSGPGPHKMLTFFSSRGAQTPPALPRIGLTSLIQEVPDSTSSAANRADEGGHHRCTHKIKWITKQFIVDHFQIDHWLEVFP